MPTYEYACRDCGHRFEIVQSMRDAPLTACPKCDGPLRKVFAPPAISFKGSGFYATDHGRSKQPAEASEKKTDQTKTGDTKTGDTKTGDTKTGERKTGAPKHEKKESTSTGSGSEKAGSGAGAPSGSKDGGAS